MRAMVLKEVSPIEKEPLEMINLPDPVPGPKEILVKVSTCGICHTELDEIEGRIQPRLPIVLGHEIIGKVDRIGPYAKKINLGQRVGIGWIHSSCGKCFFCQEGNENLCQEFKSTGCDVHGGYGQYTVVSENFAYLIPERFSDSEAAPLLCAGAIGYRDLRLSGIKRGRLWGFLDSELPPILSSRWLNIKVMKYWSSQEVKSIEL